MTLTPEMANRKIETYNHLAQGFAALARIVSDAYYDQFDTHYMTRIPAITAPVVVSEGHPVLPIADIPAEEDASGTASSVCGEEKSSKNTSRKDVQTCRASAGTVKKCATKHSQATNEPKKNTVLGETSTLESFVSTAQEVAQDSKNSEKHPLDMSGESKKASTPSLVEVRAVLAELSRAGYTAEVRDLIVSLGFEKLSEIPAELYPQVLAKAEVIGHA